MSEKEWSDSSDKTVAAPSSEVHPPEPRSPLETAHHAKTSRPASRMSVEERTSISGDSLLTVSDHEGSSQGQYNDKQLQPHISHTSSIGGVVPTLARSTTQRTNGTTGTQRDYAFEIDFAEVDKGDPRQWSFWYKAYVLFIMSLGTTSVVLYSTSYTSSIPGLQKQFGISETIGVVGMTTYMLGIACGAIVLAPLSEMYGRRPVYIVALGVFLLFVLPCALAQNITTILVSRFFGAFCAAALISNSPGTVSDIVDDEHRAMFFSIWSIGPMNGPVIGPVVGGFVFQYAGWRWTNWVVLIAAGFAWITVGSISETYTPTILRKRAAEKRKETGDARWWSRYDEKAEFLPLLKINLSRPFVMAVTEPICLFWDLYIALVYGILYLCFVAYPIIFTDLRGWSYGISGLAFSGIGVGSMIVICSEPLIRKVIHMHKPDPDSPTGDPPPEAMVSVVCLAAVLLPIGEIWFAWTGTPNVHWIVPILAGIPFGMGNGGVFIYATNYLVHSYGMYAASALAGNAVLRSIMGATMPLAGTAMYRNLGPHWAGTLLALLEAVCIPIPFIFYKYGHKIRQKSTLIRAMRAELEKANAKRAKAEAKERARLRIEADMGAAMGTGAAIDEEVDIEKALSAEEHAVHHSEKQ